MRSASSGLVVSVAAVAFLLAPFLLAIPFVVIDMREHDRLIDGLDARIRHHAEVELGLDCEGPAIRNVGTYLGGGGECDVGIELKCTGSYGGTDFDAPDPVQVRRERSGVLWLVSDIDSLETGMDPRCW